MTTVSRGAFATIGITNKDPYVIESTTIQMGVDSFPSAVCKVHTRKAARIEAMTMTSASAASDAGNLQSGMFMTRTSPDVHISAFDDTGARSLEFHGMLSNPGLEFSSRSAGLSLRAVHEVAPLMGFSTRIYDTPAYEWRNIDDAVKSDNLAERILEVHKDYIKQWEGKRGIDTGVDAKTKLIQDQQHETNKKLFPIWEAILKNTGDAMNWDEIKEFPPGQKAILDQAILRAFLSGGTDFSSVIFSIAGTFQAAYVPDLTPGKYGKFVRRKNLFQNPEDFKITPTSVRYNVGSSKLIPITHAIVTGVTSAASRTTPEGYSNSPPSIAGAWPETAYTGGGLAAEPAPSWLIPSGGVDDSLSADKQGEGRLDLFLEKTITARVQAGLASLIDQSANLCSQWARDMYQWYSLSSSYATATVPLDVNMKPGTYYSVKDTDGNELFKGLLREVRHDIAGGQKPEASTMLNFSHIEAAGFTLPEGYNS